MSKSSSILEKAKNIIAKVKNSPEFALFSHARAKQIIIISNSKKSSKSLAKLSKILYLDKVFSVEFSQGMICTSPLIHLCFLFLYEI